MENKKNIYFVLYEFDKLNMPDGRTINM